MKIKCPACGYENYFTGLEDAGTMFCCNCNNNKPLVKPKIPDATESSDYDSLDPHKENIEAYKKAIRINPNDAVAYYNLGLAYGKLGLYKEAIEAYKQAIRIDSTQAIPHLNLGIAYLLIGDKNSALFEYNILKELDSDLAKRLELNLR